MTCYSVAPRCRFRIDVVTLDAAWSGEFFAPERDRVPDPNPRLAREVTWRRMSSMETDGPSIWGSWSPKTSQRILGFRRVRFRLRVALLALHTVDIFILSLLSIGRLSHRCTCRTWTRHSSSPASCRARRGP